ncbi:cell division protein FtsX [Patescibacteria group bacterium]
MSGSSFKRLIITGFQNYWRNVGLTIATTFVMSLTLFLISAILLLNVIGGITLRTVQEKVDVSVYFNPEASELDIQKARLDVESIPEVASVRYVSQDDALAEFEDKWKDNQIIADSLQELTQNPLEPTLIVKAKNPEQYEKITAFLEVQKKEGVIERVTFDDNRAIIERLDKGVSIVRNGGVAITIVFVMIAVIVMFNTIRLTIFSRNKEITIMKLVGATNSYIRTPFIIEGVMYGVFASVLAFIVLYPILSILGPKMESFFQIESDTSLLDFFVDHVFANLFVLLGIGLLLGIISSFIAVRRYLKVGS